MSHTIIVGIDGSSNSNGAVQWAVKHAQVSSAEIRLIAAYTIPGVAMSKSDIAYPIDFDSAVKDSTKQLAEATAQVVRDAGVHVTTVVTPGDASGVMVEHSKSADLAVIGARGRGGFHGRLLGSVALAMPAHAQCPTVIIPCTWPERPELAHTVPIDLPVRSSGPRQFTDDDRRSRPDFSGEIVAGADPFEAGSPVLREAAIQARLYGRPLHLVGITSTHILSPEWMPSEAHLQKMYDEAAARREMEVATLADEFPEVEIRWSIFDAPAAEVLVNASYTADLMIIGSRGRGGFVATLLGSTSQAVMAHAVCPVRVVKVPRRKNAHHRTSE